MGLWASGGRSLHCLHLRARAPEASVFAFSFFIGFRARKLQVSKSRAEAKVPSLLLNHPGKSLPQVPLLGGRAVLLPVLLSYLLTQVIIWGSTASQQPGSCKISPESPYLKS